MKNIILLIVAFLSWDSLAGLPPTTLSGVEQTVKPTTFNFKAPNYTATQTSGITSLIETGNDNILANPSFEHQSYDTSWTVGGTATASENTSAAFISSGKKSLKFVASSQTFTLDQDSTLYASAWTGNPQGVLLVDIYSTHDADITVCSKSAGTASTTNCVVLGASQRNGLIQTVTLPTVLGATSNGVSISGASGSGDTYIDNVRVKADSLTQTQGLIGAWTSYTPTFTGLGTVTSVTFFWRQVGDSIEVNGNVTSGTVSGALVSVTLPAQFTLNSSKIAASNTTAAAGSSVGSHSQNGSSSAHGAMVTATGTSSTQVYFGGNTTGAVMLVPTIGTTVASSSLAMSINFKVPVQELTNSVPFYSQSCGAECVDTFSAQIDAAASVSDENYDFLTTCTDADPRVCTFTTSFFSVTPLCWATNPQPGGAYATVTATTSSNVTINTTDANTLFTLFCQKQGADFVATRQITGTFKEVVTSPGIAKPKTCHYAFGGAAATLASPTGCTTGTCVEVYDSCSNGAPPSYNDVGRYHDITFANGTWRGNAFLKCECTAFSAASGNQLDCSPYFITGDDTWLTNSDGGYVTNISSFNKAGTPLNTFSVLTCTGSAP